MTSTADNNQELRIGSRQAPSLAAIQARFIDWATATDDIRAAFVIGSQARTDHPADPWSDLDIVVFANNVTRYQENLDWIAALAPTWIILRGQTVAGDPERLTLFAGGFQVDFVLHDAAIMPGFRQMVASGNIPDTVRRGAKVLVDKDAMIPELPAPAPPPPGGLPSEAAFRLWLNQFWFSAVYAAKQLRRGDLLAFKGADAALKQQVLPLIEWHTHATRGRDIDTWHNGRFLREWADPRIYAALGRTYTAFDETASWDGLIALAEMVQWVTAETAASLGFDYPVDTLDQLQQYIAGLRADSGLAPTS